MSRLKPQKCPECGLNYIRFDLHWINCPKNNPKLDVSNPVTQKLDVTRPKTTNELDDLHSQILTEFKQVYKLHPADYTENCTNVVMSIIEKENQS